MTTADREIVLERLLDAPRQLVFDAFTTPEHVVHWWGPTGFTITNHEMDVRPGGVWRFMMHGPDGVDYPNLVEFIEVSRPDRLVYQHRGERSDESTFQVTVTFDDAGGRTRLTMRMVFPSAEARDFVVREFGAIERGNETLDRLASYVVDLDGSRSTSS